MLRKPKRKARRSLHPREMEDHPETSHSLDETLPSTLRLPRKTMTPQIAQAAGRVVREDERAEADAL